MPPDPKPFEREKSEAFSGVRPTYGVVPVQQQDNVLGTRNPGAWLGLKARWEEGYAPKLWNRIQSDLVPEDPNFNPWPGIEGYEEYADSLASSGSKIEQDMIKAQIDRSHANNRIMAANEWGLMAEIMGGLAVGLADPANLIPVPVVKGIGMVKGALRMGASTAAIAAGTEGIRLRVDPTMQPSDMAYSIGIAGLLGGLLGAPIGSWGARTRRAARNFETLLSDVDYDNHSLAVRGQDEGIRIELGERPLRGPDGAPSRFSTTIEPGAYAMKAVGGEYFTFSDERNSWIYAADREVESPRPVSQDIIDQLAAPERVMEKVKRVDQAGIKDDFTKPGWKDRVAPFLEEGENVETVIRHADDLVNFETRWDLWRDILPRKADETSQAWHLRTGKEAMKDYKGSKVGGTLARAKGMEYLLEKGMFSPVVKATRPFPNDNVVLDMATRLGGDYGWAVRAAEFGFRAPPPLLLKAMKHSARWFEFKADLDREWLRYAKGQKDAAGKTVLDWNLSAAAQAAKASVNRRLGKNVLTYDDFSEMVGMAVYFKNDFDLRGHPVNEYARAAAKSYTRMMQEMDEAFLAAGMFAEQKGLTQQISRSEREIVRLKERLVRRMWGGETEPSALTPAIKVNDRVWAGETHDAAIRQMIDVLGTEGMDLSEQMTTNDYGYLDQAAEFRTVDETIASRVDSMPDAQRALYDERVSALRMAEEYHAQLTATLDEVTKRPHRFLDGNGNPEPYFTRFWNTAKMADERRKIGYLFEKWFERDNPNGAHERAMKSVDDITTNEEEGSAYSRMGAFRPLNRRVLDIPNSWQVEHPTFGTLRIADYIENNILATSETYMRRGGTRLEAARMFGDANLQGEKIRMREYLLERYWEKETTDEGRAAVMAKIKEVEGHLDITARWALGSLRTSDPWRLDNRIARNMMDVTSLAVMGKVLLTAIPEIARPGMVAGMGTAFRTIFMRAFSDLEQVRHNKAFNRLMPELMDMNTRRSNARFQEMQQGDMVARSTWVDRLISDRIPGFFKLVGLTPWTVFWKDMAMSAAQHAVMDESKQLAHAVRTGGTIPQNVELRLAALGINARDALLLDSMPIEHWRDGELILPAVQNWTGPDGRRARELLLTAITAETRRAIVTPSIGDKSTVFAGVLTSKGQKTLETDIMKIPMQFLSYGVAAHNKLLISSLQGRDRSAIGGLFFMLLLGAFATWAKTPTAVRQKKSYEELMLESWENAGIGGFWFGDLNQQIERFGVGIRPLSGLPPKFGKAGEEEGLVDTVGPAPGLFFDVSKAFTDSDLQASQRAQLIRRGVPYNNMLWWGWAARELAGGVGGAFEGDRQ